MRKVALALGIGGAGVLLAAAAFAARVPVWAPLPGAWPAEGAVPEGAKLAGEPVTDASLPSVLRRRADELTAQKVTFVLPGDGGQPEKTVATASLASLGVGVDLTRTERWLRSTTGADWAERLESAREAKRGAIDVPLALMIDRAPALALLQDVKEAEDRDPVSARLDLAKRTVVPERTGRYVDPHAAADAVAKLAAGLARGERPELRVVLTSQSFPPRLTTTYVKALDVSQVIGQFETYFSRKGDQARRAKNIEVAAAKLDGLILAPGELVSFNQVVGDRSEENGFAKAWEIFKGEMKEGVGGGTCQVASTFHAAAVFAGIDILERLPHSRPSAYIPIGLDATVVYPVVDMKMRNPHSFPVAIHTAVEGNKVRFEVLGPKKFGRVTFAREIVETFPYDRKVEEDAAVPAGKVVVKQHGIRGFRVKRTRELVSETGAKRVETSKDYYPPTLEIFKVAPGFDVAKLPPLPDAEATTSAGATPAAPATASQPATNGEKATDPPAPDFVLVDGPGAHAPTKQQADPTTTLTIRR